MPSHPALRVHANHLWRDVHFANDPKTCTRLEIVPSAGASTKERLKQTGGALQAVLNDVFGRQAALRVGGGAWSLSSIGVPGEFLLDLSSTSSLGPVPESWPTSGYRAKCESSSTTPILISGSLSINQVNRLLSERGLALQTSGASDGQSLAGAIATGTHGADLRVGALHDTVTGIHLVVGPNQAWFLQPSSAPFEAKTATSLSNWYGIPCEIKADDELFRAALVHLGSLGIVLNLVVETVPLYYLERTVTAHAEGAYEAVLGSRDPAALGSIHPTSPDYLQLILNPYLPAPESAPRAWLIAMAKHGYAHQPDVLTSAPLDSLNSDLTQFLPMLIEAFEGEFEIPTNPGLRRLTTQQLVELYGSWPARIKAVPGVMFGPPSFLGMDFAPTRGASAEYVFSAAQARTGVLAILRGLEEARSSFHQYFGGLGVRFVRGSSALLAPNLHDLNCFVELQGLVTKELGAVHEAVQAALQEDGVTYGGHWGQRPLNSRAVVQSHWGERARKWCSARDRILDTATARIVFSSPILADAGLAPVNGLV